MACEVSHDHVVVVDVFLVVVVLVIVVVFVFVGGCDGNENNFHVKMACEVSLDSFVVVIFVDGIF